MDDLSHRFPALLVPTSQSAGGEVHGAGHAQTAPGSQPISAPEPGDLTNENLAGLAVNQLGASGAPTDLVHGANPDRPDLWKSVSGATWA